MKKIFTLVLLLSAVFGYSQSSSVVISQAYGGGGGASGTYKHDYVELKNISAVDQNIGGFSIQYGSGSGDFASNVGNIYEIPANTIMPAGSYLLVQFGNPGSGGVDLPVPADLVTTQINMGGTNGKILLSNQNTPVGCGATATPCTLPAANIIDLVSYGTANNAEGGVSVNNGALLTSVQASVRKMNGCQDTDNNNADFDVVTNAVPRNSSTPVATCGSTATPTLTAGTVNDFGNVIILTNSTPQSFNISATQLTGAPGLITVTAPSTDFEVSNDNSTWSASTTIAYTGATLASTPVYVRFTPQTVGPKSGNLSLTGGGLANPVTVAVSGNGITASTPTFTATALNAFGNVCLNTTSAPQSFTLTGNNLGVEDIQIAAIAGYTYSTTLNGTYTPTLVLSQPGGAFSQEIFVQFTPTTAESYNGNIAISGASVSSPVLVPVSGTGVNGLAQVVTAPVTNIGSNSAEAAGVIVNTGCSNVTVYGIEYSTSNGFANGTGTQVVSGNLSSGNFSATLSSLAQATTYYYKAYATNDGGTAYGSQQSFSTLAPPPASIVATIVPGFGTICMGELSAPNSFTLTGTNLTAGDITVGPLDGYLFSLTETGNFTNSITINQTGGAFTQIVFVKFNPQATGDFAGAISIVGGGANGTANVTGVSDASPASSVANDATGVTASSANVSASITAAGCSAVTNYGFEYSTLNNFAEGSGVNVVATSVGDDFNATINGLVPATTYYYRSYTQNAGGKLYSDQKSFTTTSIASNLVIYGSPVAVGSTLRYSIGDIKPGHYATALYNSVGQKVFKKEIIIQVGMIDDQFKLPAYLPAGMYVLQIENYEFKVRKTFMIN